MSRNLILSSGVDTLILYCDSSVIDYCRVICDLEFIGIDDGGIVCGLPVVRLSSPFRAYGFGFKCGEFQIYVNKKSLYIRVGALPLLMFGYDTSIVNVCRILDNFRHKDFVLDRIPWTDLLRVSRIDTYFDFAYDRDMRFNREQFKTRMRRSGEWQSGDNGEAITYYFGDRRVFLIRIYNKQAEAESSGKSYFNYEWRAKGLKENQVVWRFEAEFRPRKLDEVVGYRDLTAYDETVIEQLLSYATDSLQLCDRVYKGNNMSKAPLHPLWKKFKKNFCTPYAIHPKKIEQANIQFRRKLARKWVMSFYAATGCSYDNLPMRVLRDFDITESDYRKAQFALPLSTENSLPELELDNHSKYFIEEGG